MRRWIAVASLIFGVSIPAAHGQEAGAPLRAEWTVERTGSGRARVAGYVHNLNSLRDGTNVALRVEQLGPDGRVVGVQRSRLVGDVQSGGRLAFAVPVATDAAAYRVLIDAVDWVDQCR
jgi:hypothetical protein